MADARRPLPRRDAPDEAGLLRRARELRDEFALRRTVRDFSSRPVPREVIEDALRAAGLRVLATSSHHGIVYTDADLTGPVAMVVGNEAHGVADDEPVDGWLTIPQAGAAESLNVAMAATVLAFEVARQRRLA